MGDTNGGMYGVPQGFWMGVNGDHHNGLELHGHADIRSDICKAEANIRSEVKETESDVKDAIRGVVDKLSNENLMLHNRLCEAEKETLRQTKEVLEKVDSETDKLQAYLRDFERNQDSRFLRVDDKLNCHQLDMTKEFCRVREEFGRVREQHLEFRNAELKDQIHVLRDEVQLCKICKCATPTGNTPPGQS